MRTVAPLIVFALISGCATHSTGPVFTDVPPIDATTEPRPIALGDHFPVTIGLGPTPPVVVEVTVDADGFIELPQIGKLHVAGLKPSQFEDAAIAEYRRRGIVLHGMVHPGIVR